MNRPVDHRDFNFPPLRKAELLTDPVAQFQRWVDDARAAKVSDWEAMTLATSSAEGRPTARVVFLRGADRRGFVFYTSYESRKGKQLAENPQAALVLHWRELEGLR